MCLSAVAQRSDRSFNTTANDCDAVQWSDAILEQYPDIGSACQSVENRNGKVFVKFSAKVVRNEGNRGKTLTLDIKDGNEIVIAVPEEATLFIDGRKTPMASVRRGDRLNFYVPQGRLTAQFYADNQTVDATPLVVAPILLDPPSDAEDQSEQKLAMLPATASNNALIALIGFLVLSVAVGLMVFRLRSNGYKS
jgi:LPXTG-motif cell wall-anchored protein